MACLKNKDTYWNLCPLGDWKTIPKYESRKHILAQDSLECILVMALFAW